MQFDHEAFNTTTAKMREQKLEVTHPTVKKFFKPEEGDDEKSPCFWTLRQLSGLEVATVNQEISNSKNLGDLIEQVFSSIPKEKMGAIKKLAGVSGDVNAQGEPEELPEDYVRRMYMLLYGSVEPKVPDIQWVIKFANLFPQEFFRLTTRIINLTGLGAELGE